jgi:hypothetical protein
MRPSKIYPNTFSIGRYTRPFGEKMRPYSFSKPKIRRLKGLGCNMRIQTEYQPATPSSTEGSDSAMETG